MEEGILDGRHQKGAEIRRAIKLMFSDAHRLRLWSQIPKFASHGDSTSRLHSFNVSLLPGSTKMLIYVRRHWQLVLCCINYLNWTTSIFHSITTKSQPNQMSFLLSPSSPMISNLTPPCNDKHSETCNPEDTIVSPILQWRKSYVETPSKTVAARVHWHTKRASFKSSSGYRLRPS